MTEPVRRSTLQEKRGHRLQTPLSSTSGNSLSSCGGERARYDYRATSSPRRAMRVTHFE